MVVAQVEQEHQAVLAQVQEDLIQYFHQLHQQVVVVDLDVEVLPILIHKDQEVLVEEIQEMLLVDQEQEIEIEALLKQLIASGYF